MIYMFICEYIFISKYSPGLRPMACENTSFTKDKTFFSFNHPRASRVGRPGAICRPIAQHPIPEKRPKAGQKLTTIAFLGAPVPFKKRPIFGPPQNRPRGWQSRPLAALGPPGWPKKMILGSFLALFLEPFSCIS